MGNIDRINELIGTPEFNSLYSFAQPNDLTCFNNCNLVKIDCDLVEHTITNVIQIFNTNSIKLSCPIEFYNCTNNIATNKTLLSGYYVNQKLRDGSKVDKPLNGIKCSHGGMLDSSSFVAPKGGINKDSGYFILSPHAHLHTIGKKINKESFLSKFLYLYFIS
jgi:hypothetical protein